MVLNYVEYFIKLLGLNLCISYCFMRIINYTHLKNIKKLCITVTSIILSIFTIFLKQYFSTIFSCIIIYWIYTVIFCIITKYKLGYCLIITIFSVSVSCIIHTFSSTIITIFETFLNISINTSLFFIIIFIFDFFLIFNFFHIKRFKNGFQFIKSKSQNEYLDIFMVIISILTINVYILVGNYNEINRQYLFYEFILLSILMVVVIQKTFILYQKQKLLEKTLKEYEQEIKEKDEKIDKLLSEENKLVKANHEFYHRQEALKHKLINLKETSENFAEEYGEILARINNLSDEYKSKTENSNILHKLPKCEITELDDMFSYMQSECFKNNIEFILKINGNIHSLINNIIPKDRLETLIGDLIRNSIIAINYSNKEYRSIMAILGIKEDSFEFCIYDSGIEFEINTLLKLGLEKATTHSDNGGTGIGFITTFETLKLCNASLIINELSPSKNNYTKSITIRFNNKLEYIVNSYRFSEFSNISKKRNDIIVNPYE